MAARPAAWRESRDFCVVTKARVGKVLSDSGFGNKAHSAGRTPAAGNEPAADGVVVPAKVGWQEAIAATVAGLGYELVDVERAQRGLLRITIDRIPGHVYRTGRGPDAVVDSNEFVTVEDCEQVTRQLQYALEVEGLDYARLEVSSPGLDRPLCKAADFARFAGSKVDVKMRTRDESGRKRFTGLLRGEADGVATLEVEGRDVALRLDEIDRARLVPDLQAKGKK